MVHLTALLISDKYIYLNAYVTSSVKSSTEAFLCTASACCTQGQDADLQCGILSVEVEL